MAFCSTKANAQQVTIHGTVFNMYKTRPLDGVSVNFTFAFYSAPTAGTLYLTVSQSNVQVTKGNYNVLIGSGTVTPGTEKTLAAVFQKHAEVWMGVKINTDPEMTPRSRISSVPFALSFDLRFLDFYLNTLDWDQDGHNKKILGGDDCNDADPSIHPGAPEIPYDGIDQNCDGSDNPVPCSSPSQCGTGFCVDDYCCNNNCTGTCMACNVSGVEGICSPIPYGLDPSYECPNFHDPNCYAACNGAGACTYAISNGVYCFTETGCSEVGPVLEIWSFYCRDGYCNDYQFNLQNCCPYTCIGFNPGWCGNICGSDVQCCVDAGYHCNVGSHACQLP